MDQFVLTDSFTIDDIGAECVLLPKDQRTGKVVFLNSTGGHIVEILRKEACTIAELTRLIARKYNVQPLSVKEDVIQFLCVLEDNGVVTRL